MSFGFSELLLILVIIMVLFGAGKLPKVMGDLGKGMKSFKQAVKEDDKPSDVSANTENKS